MCSYFANMAVVVYCSKLLTPMVGGLDAVWLCVIIFQVIRLVANWSRLLNPGSPLNTRKGLAAVDLS